MSGFSWKPETSLERTVEKDSSIPRGPVESIYELQKCVEWITSNHFMKVCLQFPDPLLVDAVDIALFIEKNIERKPFILGDTSYGSCCVDEVAAEHIQGDAIIHFGHACLSPVTHLPVLYVLPKNHFSLNKFFFGIEQTDLPSPVLIVYDVGYAHMIDELRKRSTPKLIEKLVISELKTGEDEVPCCATCCLLTESNAHSSLVLGRGFCQKDSISSVIYLGPSSVTLNNFMLTFRDKKFFQFTNELCLQPLEAGSTALKKSSYLVERLKSATNIGILVGTIGVKGYLEGIRQAKRLCQRGGKRSFTIAVGKPNPAKLANFPEIDIFVAVGCPEMSFGDLKTYLQPIAGLFELEIAFNRNRSWDASFSKDFRDLIPGGRHYVPFPENHVLPNETVSLATNKLLGAAVDCSSESTELVKQEMTLTSLNSSANFTRTWTGLEQNIGDTQPQLVEKGRSGIPMSYDDEKELS